MRRKLHALEDRLGLAFGNESSSYRLAFTFSMALGSNQLSQLPTSDLRYVKDWSQRIDLEAWSNSNPIGHVLSIVQLASHSVF